MSYESEVLADSPIFFGRLDELSGTVINDASGNGNDGTYDGSAVLGITSPIETDASSRAVEGKVGTLPGAVDPRVTWTDEVWILYTEDLFITGTGICRGGQVGLSASNYVVVDSGQARAQVSTTGGSYDLFWPLPAFGWYHIVAGRLGSLMVLYVNGFLRAARTDLDSGNRAGFGIGSDVYHLGVSQSSGAWVSIGTDEPAIYDYLLSGDRVLAHYMAALINPPVFLRGDLHFNCYIAGDFAAPPALLPFLPNWEAPIKETLAWLTDVLPARQDYEQRAAVRTRPRRSLEYDFSFLSNAERRKFKAFLFANQKRPIYVPIVTDAVNLTADAPAGSTALEFVSETFDFNDGGVLALYADETTTEVATIDAVGETSTTLTAPTTNDWAEHSLVIPVARAIVDRPLQINRVTDSIEDAAARFRILAQDVPLAPHRLGTYSPRYTVNDIEVFDPFVLGPNNWEEDGKGEVSIRATESESAAGVFTLTPWDSAPREITSYNFFLYGRTEIATFLAWWWNMEGRTKPIWVPTLQEDFSIVSSHTGPLRIVVEDHEQSEFYLCHKSRRDLAIVYTNETMVFKRIGSAAASGANDTLFLEGFGGVSLTNLWFVSFLKLSRLNEDTIDLVWHTDQLVEVSLNFIDETPTDDQ